jgi:hypothetical protein
MNVFVRSNKRLKTSIVALAIFTVAILTGCKKEIRDREFALSVVASRLENPLGLELDAAGNIWVTEGETKNNDGKVVMITPDGNLHDAVVNLSAFVNAHSGQPQGAAHLLLDGKTLYILSGSYLYNINISTFKPGNPPIDASKLPFEDIGSFVRSYPFVNNTHDTHPYNLTKGTNGDIYIADAGANAIIRRKSAGKYSILAEIPGFANPTPVGPPQIEAVPTSLHFEGQNLLVTTLTGFPFVEGKAAVYKVTPAGKVSVYQSGFTTLVDMSDVSSYGHLLLQHGTFGQTGFVANTGSLIFSDGSGKEVLTKTLNTPVALKQVNSSTWYITSMGDGTVLKATYK